MSKNSSVDYFVYVLSFSPFVLFVVFFQLSGEGLSERLILSVLGLAPVLIGGYWAHDLLRSLISEKRQKVYSSFGKIKRLGIAIASSLLAQIVVYVSLQISIKAVIIAVVLSPATIRSPANKDIRKRLAPIIVSFYEGSWELC